MRPIYLQRRKNDFVLLSLSPVGREAKIPFPATKEENVSTPRDFSRITQSYRSLHALGYSRIAQGPDCKNTSHRGEEKKGEYTRSATPAARGGQKHVRKIFHVEQFTLLRTQSTRPDFHEKCKRKSAINIYVAEVKRRRVVTNCTRYVVLSLRSLAR